MERCRGRGRERTDGNMPSGTSGVACILVVMIFSCMMPQVMYDTWSPMKQMPSFIAWLLVG